MSAVLGASRLRGFASLLLRPRSSALIGIDPTDRARRGFTLGIPELLDGIDVVVVAVGLFAVGETLYVAAHRDAVDDEIVTSTGRCG